jgi:molybdate transport system substrate-binding protein
MNISERTDMVLRLLFVLATALAIAGAPAAGHAADLLVFAAASLKDALDAINKAYTAGSGQPVVVSYAASSALARQIEEAAPADVFVSADLDWMNYLEERDLIDEASRAVLVGNEIVLVAPADSTTTVTIAPGFDLAGALGADGLLAMADPEAVPAGRYGKASLESLGVWESVSGRIAGAENVRAALALVSRGEAPLGIVYATDAAADPGVRVVGTFPADSHPPIQYPAAVLAGSTNDAASGYVDFLKSPAAAEIFTRFGFTEP